MARWSTGPHACAILDAAFTLEDRRVLQEPADPCVAGVARAPGPANNSKETPPPLATCNCRCCMLSPAPFLTITRRGDGMMTVQRGKVRHWPVREPVEHRPVEHGLVAGLLEVVVQHGHNAMPQLKLSLRVIPSTIPYRMW